MIEKIRGIGGPEPIKGIKEQKVEKYKGKVEKGETIDTEASEFVKKVTEMAKDIDEIRVELVEEIKKAIKSGEYVIDIENIAKKMLGGT